ncbi:hypothetical protein ACLMJK_008255 [Lecanora helva]
MSHSDSQSAQTSNPYRQSEQNSSQSFQSSVSNGVNGVDGVNGVNSAPSTPAATSQHPHVPQPNGDNQSSGNPITCAAYCLSRALINSQSCHPIFSPDLQLSAADLNAEYQSWDSHTIEVPAEDNVEPPWSEPPVAMSKFPCPRLGDSGGPLEEYWGAIWYTWSDPTGRGFIASFRLRDRIVINIARSRPCLEPVDHQLHILTERVAEPPPIQSSPQPGHFIYAPFTLQPQSDVARSAATYVHTSAQAEAPSGDQASGQEPGPSEGPQRMSQASQQADGYVDGQDEDEMGTG